MFYDTNGVDLNHFCYIRGGLEYIGVDKSLNDASLAERRASRWVICEMFEQADDTMLDFNIGFWEQ
jgi:hypothetical protein